MTMNSGNLKAMQKQELGGFCANLWNGVNFASKLANMDKDYYEAYKDDRDSVPDAKLVDMQILNCLESLGYPMDELGTYLYKNVVLSTYSEVVDNDVRNDKSLADSLLLKLNYRLSNFYHELARNDLDMGVKTFHQYILIAMSKIDSDNIDKSLEKKIYGDTKPASYGTMAFKIALYLDNENEKTIEKQSLK